MGNRGRIIAAGRVVLLTVLLVIAGRTPVVAQEEGQPEPPEVTARAVFAVDTTAGVELYARNADEELPPASLTKIASAIVVLQNAELDEAVTIAERDLVDATLYSSMNLVAGDTLTVEQLLYGMMLPSGNDAALALARHVGERLGATGDPVAAFVEAMNRLAADLRLKNTRFTNPVGLDDPDHYSSARDLAVLARRAMSFRIFREIVREPSYTVVSIGPEQRPYELVNFNRLLGDGVHGIKTGSTEAAGGCLVIASWAHGRNRVITVILGSDLAYGADNQIATDARWEDMSAILSAMDQDYRWVAPEEPEEMPGLDEEMAAWGVALKDPAAVVVPRRRGDELRYRLQLGPEAASGDEVGRVLFFLGSEVVAERPVFQI